MPRDLYSAGLDFFRNRLPKPVLIATEEFLDGELFYKENKPQA